MASEKVKLSDDDYQPLSEQFWDVVAPLLAEDGTEESTMMGTPCVRVNGEFVAMVTQSFSGRLIVKLPAQRVAAYIAEEVGEEFAPAKRVFKEWLWVLGDDADQWRELTRESWEFVSTLPPKKPKKSKKKTATSPTKAKKGAG